MALTNLLVDARKRWQLRSIVILGDSKEHYLRAIHNSCVIG